MDIPHTNHGEHKDIKRVSTFLYPLVKGKLDARRNGEQTKCRCCREISVPHEGRRSLILVQELKLQRHAI
jgi:hypothetical protein